MKTTVDELASSMGRIIPIANGLNVPFNTLNGAMASLTAGGISTAESTTYLKSMLNELGKSGTKVSDVLKEQTGKSFAELMENGTSLSEILGIVKDDAEKNGLAFTDLFGSSEAATAAMALMRDGGVDLDNKIKDITNTTGSANEAFEKMEDTAGAKLTKALNSMKISLIDVGDALAPLIEKASEFISKVADWVAKFGELSPATQNVILGFVAFLAILGPLLTIVGAGITLFANLSIVAGALGMTVGALVLSVASAVAPFIAIAVAIGAFIAILVKAYNENENFRKSVDSVFNDVRMIISSVMSAIGSIITTIWNLIKLIWKGGLNDLVNGTITNLGNLLSIFTSSLNNILTFVSGVVKLICAVFSGDFGAIPSIVNGILNNMVNGFNEKMNRAKKFVSDGIEGMKKLFNITFPTPKIKMPHISISGKFSINPPSVPKFGKLMPTT